MVFHWSLSDSKSPQVSRTLISILAVLNNDVVWMVSTHPSTSTSSWSFNNPLVTVPKAPITIGIIVTFMFHSFFQFPSKVEVLILLFTFFQFYSMVSSYWNIAKMKISSMLRNKRRKRNSLLTIVTCQLWNPCQENSWWDKMLRIRVPSKFPSSNIGLHDTRRGAGDVMIIVIRDGHGDPSLNPKWSCWHFTECKYSRER